jgi:enoyl-[acyl-carrier protein] reductase II
MFHTVICDMLDIRLPILQGAMQGAGGPDMVAAVSNAGGLGILPTFGSTEDVLRQDITAARQMTNQPFAVNITPMGRAFTESRAQICIDEGIKIVTTGRADPGEGAVQMMKAAGIKVLSVIPSVDHAKRMEDEGVDAVIASGNEAGGHVGHIATMPLIPQVVDAVDIPVLAAGGIGDGRGFLAAFALGALGVQIGTCLMPSPESDAGDWIKQQVLDSTGTNTMVTKSVTGATMRAIATPEVKAYENARVSGASKQELKALHTQVRQHSGYTDESAKELRRQGTIGQIAGMVNDARPAGEIVTQMVEQAVKLSGRLNEMAAA